MSSNARSESGTATPIVVSWCWCFLNVAMWSGMEVPSSATKRYSRRRAASAPRMPFGSLISTNCCHICFAVVAPVRWTSSVSEIHSEMRAIQWSFSVSYFSTALVSASVGFSGSTTLGGVASEMYLPRELSLRIAFTRVLHAVQFESLSGSIRSIALWRLEVDIACR